MSQDIFIEICETLRLAKLKKYSTDELLAELKSRGVSIESKRPNGHLKTREQATRDGSPNGEPTQ